MEVKYYYLGYLKALHNGNITKLKHYVLRTKALDATCEMFNLPLNEVVKLIEQ